MLWLKGSVLNYSGILVTELLISGFATISDEAALRDDPCSAKEHGIWLAVIGSRDSLAEVASLPAEVKGDDFPDGGDRYLSKEIYLREAY